MAHFLRLMFCGLLCLAGTAGAVVPTVASWGYSNPGYGASGPLVGSGFSTAVAACQDFIAKSNPWRSSPVFFRDVLGMACRLDRPAGTFYESQQLTTAQVCPANSALVGGQCQCSDGYIEDSTKTSCVLPPDPCAALAGQDAGDWVRDKGVNAAGTGPVSRSWSVCNAYSSTAGGKCVVTVSNATCDEVGFGTDVGPGQGFFRCVGRGIYTGTSAISGKCDPTSAGKGTGDSPVDPSPATPPVPGSDPPKAPTPKPPDGLPAPAPCPAGQAPGTVNGTTACYPTGSDTPKAGGKDSSTNNSDGSKETKHEETTCNAGGSKCSTDTTTCKTAAGATTSTCSTVTTTDTAQGTCQKSPGNSVCAGGNGSPGSSFGGNCKAGFKAVGEDPVLNAIAQEQYKRNCELFESDTEERQGYEADKAKTKSGTDRTGELSEGSKRTVSIGPSSFDGSSAIGSSQCITDRTISMSGYSITLPFSRICQYLEYIGTLLMVVSYLTAARIVVRG